MPNKIICISRQFGSGGHEIAVKLAERLGIRVYEKDILHLACKFGELSVSAMEDADEKAAPEPAPAAPQDAPRAEEGQQQEGLSSLIGSVIKGAQKILESFGIGGPARRAS